MTFAGAQSGNSFSIDGMLGNAKWYKNSMALLRKDFRSNRPSITNVIQKQFNCMLPSSKLTLLVVNLKDWKGTYNGGYFAIHVGLLFLLGDERFSIATRTLDALRTLYSSHRPIRFKTLVRT